MSRDAQTSPVGFAHDRLDHAIIAGHAATPADPARLSTLYRQGAALAPAPDATRFLLTHAWVLALEAGDGEAVGALEHDLRALGGLRRASDCGDTRL